MMVKAFATPEPQEILQHATPFLFIDHIVEISEREIICTKHISHHEPYLSGHFPGNPIVPGVLLIEMCAQAGLLLVLSMSADPGANNPPGYLAQVDRTKFYRPARPGDTLSIHATKEWITSSYVRVEASVCQAGERSRKVCHGSLIVYVPIQTSV